MTITKEERALLRRKAEQAEGDGSECPTQIETEGGFWEPAVTIRAREVRVLLDALDEMKARAEKAEARVVRLTAALTAASANLYAAACGHLPPSAAKIAKDDAQRALADTKEPA